MIVYKLTDENACSLGNTHWTIGKTNTATGEGGLCGPGWLHCYEHPLLAVLHDPIHGVFGPTARMFRCEAGGKILKDDQTKMGCTELTPIEEIPLPSVTTTQRISYAIHCAQCVYHDQWWTAWADKWLSGEDRTFAAARTAEAATAEWSARAAAARAAAAAADGAEWSARWAAAAARWAAEAAEAAEAARWEEAAEAVAAAVNLIACAEKAMRIQ